MDHKKFPEDFINQLSRNFPDCGIILSEKDFVKVNPQLVSTDMAVIRQKIHIPENILHKILQEL
jgi:tetraacyldisaccharide-1-P 4'-kinase